MEYNCCNIYFGFIAGFEVSGIVDELCPTLGLVKECPVKVGDRVIVYPANEEEFTETG